MMFQEKIKKSYLENRTLFLCILFVCLAYGLTRFFTEEKKISSSSKPVAADTIIPAGMVLVPIELANIESIRGLIHGFGFIDLYLAEEGKIHRRRIGHKIKILQAPLNHNEFAILVSEELSGTIMKTQGIYTGVVQNRIENTENSSSEKNERRFVSSETQIEYSPEDQL